MTGAHVHMHQLCAVCFFDTQCAHLLHGAGVELLVPHAAAHQRPQAVKLLFKSTSPAVVVLRLVLPLVELGATFAVGRFLASAALLKVAKNDRFVRVTHHNV